MTSVRYARCAHGEAVLEGRMTLRPWCLAPLLVLTVGCPSPTPKPPPVVEPEPTAEPEPPPQPPDPGAVVDVATFQGHHCVLRRAGTVAS